MPSPLLYQLHAPLDLQLVTAKTRRQGYAANVYHFWQWVLVFHWSESELYFLWWNKKRNSSNVGGLKTDEISKFKMYGACQLESKRTWWFFFSSGCMIQAKLNWIWFIPIFCMHLPSRISQLKSRMNNFKIKQHDTPLSFFGLHSPSGWWRAVKLNLNLDWGRATLQTVLTDKNCFRLITSNGTLTLILSIIVHCQG